MRDSFVFYASFYEAISNLPGETQLEVYNALCKYALLGELPELSPIAKAMFTVMRPVMDAASARYEASVANGKKGGRPKKENLEKPSNNLKGLETENLEKPSRNLKVNDNDNDNVNDNESECEKNAHAHTHEEIFEKFKIQCEKVAPLALDFKEPLTVEQFAKLYDKYGWQKVAQCATELHNKEANKKNRRAYTAWQAFIEKIK